MRVSARKASAAALCVLLTACISPPRAFAATKVYVDKAGYTAAASGAGWTWNGADNMTLDNYNGGSILADGNLDIVQSGTNTVDSAGMPYGIYATGDLSITGDGNLDVNVNTNEGRTCGIFAGNDLSITGNGSCDVNVNSASTTADAAGILAYCGNLDIDGTTVSVNTRGSSATGIGAPSGNVFITDSSVSSTASSSTQRSDADGAIVAGRGNGGGNITITGSDVTAKSSGQAWWGLRGYTDYDSAAPHIAIADSRVTAQGKAGAIAAYNSYAEIPGTISITGSSIVAPAGAHVQDVADSFYDMYGQAIGTGAGAITQFWLDGGDLNPDVATSVAIEKIPAAKTATPTAVAPATAAADTAATSPKTADEAPVALLVLALATAGGALFVSRRQMAK